LYCGFIDYCTRCCAPGALLYHRILIIKQRENSWSFSQIGRLFEVA
jgi:hypothetical protein